MGETTMPIRRYSKEEFSQRGNALYESQIRSQVEAGNHGKIVAIDIESGDFEVDEDTLVASDRLLERHPDAQTWFIRIGHRAVHRLFWHSPLEEWSLSEINASVRDLLDDPEEDIYTLEDGEPIDAPLQVFHDCEIPVVADEALDTTAGFAALAEAEIIQDNERRWQTFQQQGGSIPQSYVESWVENLGLHDSYEAAAVLAQFLADHQATNNG
jgi:hypothetical protein